MTAIETIRPTMPENAAQRPPTGDRLLLTLISVLPIAAIKAMSSNLFDIRGLRVAPIIAALTFLAFARRIRVWRCQDRLERNATIAFLVYLAVFAGAFFHSVPNLPTMRALDPDSFSASVVNYTGTTLVVPAL